jgi:NhaP-type Na+/H+ or K+/H+ antiporter
VPRRIVTVHEGESLINDDTTLVLYRTAVVTPTGEAFSVLDVGVQFVGTVAAGIAIDWL